MYALRPHGAETDPASPRSEDAPQEQAQQKDVRPSRGSPHVDLCSSCHRHVHVTISNKELEREYNTLEALKVHPGISRFVEWVRRKPHGTAGVSSRRLAEYHDERMR